MAGFTKTTCCIVTGCSKGLGKCIVETFARKLVSGSAIILLSRDINALEKLRESLSKDFPNIKFITHMYDQSDLRPELFDSMFGNILNKNCLSVNNFEKAVLVHNAGTLGDVTKFIRELSDKQSLEDCFAINVTGAILLNTAFLKTFDESNGIVRLVINMTSLAAIQPFKSWSMYCTVKAAREMFFRALALEEPSIKVLNYSPGPCNTDMQLACRTMTADPEVKAYFADAHSKGKILECQTSIDKMFEVLEKDAYKSGDHVDYYDPL